MIYQVHILLPRRIDIMMREVSRMTVCNSSTSLADTVLGRTAPVHRYPLKLVYQIIESGVAQWRRSPLRVASMSMTMLATLHLAVLLMEKGDHCGGQRSAVGETGSVPIVPIFIPM